MGKDYPPMLNPSAKLLIEEPVTVRRRDARHLDYRLADQDVVELIENALAHADEEVEASV